jgi:hypothetical protein
MSLDWETALSLQWFQRVRMCGIGEVMYGPRMDEGMSGATAVETHEADPSDRLT